MARKFRKPWTEEEIKRSIKKVMKITKIDRMPTQNEVRDAGEVGLNEAISKNGGYVVWAKKLGLGKKVKNNGNNKLDEEQILRCIEMRENGISYTKIAKEIGAGATCVTYNIKRNLDKKEELKETIQFKKRVGIVTHIDKIEERRQEVKMICEDIKVEKLLIQKEYKKDLIKESQALKERFSFMEEGNKLCRL